MQYNNSSNLKMGEVINLPEQQQQHRSPSASAAPPNNGSSSSTNAPKKAAFVHKLYAMLSDPKLSGLIWWTNNVQEGTFALQPGAEFAHALTGYFKHGNVASFVRQLHMYGFHKVCDQPSTNPNGNNHPVWEFIHSSGMFRKGDESSLSLIKRRTSSNTTKIKSDLNRSLSSTPAMDISYQLQLQPGAAFYYTANPYMPLYHHHHQQQQQHFQPPPGYGITMLLQGPPPTHPHQQIVYYPVPHRYSNAPQSPYPHTVTPPYPEQGVPPPQFAPQYQIHHHAPPPPPPPPHQQQQQQAAPMPQQQVPVSPQRSHIIQQEQHLLPQQPVYMQKQQISHPTPQILRQPTPTGSSISYPPQSRSVTPHSFSDSRVNSYVERISGTSKELMHGQQLLHLKSEILHNDLRESSSDTLRAAETLPSVKSSLDEGQYAEFQNKINNLKINVNSRNERYDEQQDIPADYSRSHQPSIASNSSLISFYENNNSRPRIPSMFVDPLAPLPQPQPTTSEPSQHEGAWSPSSSNGSRSLQKAPSIANIVTEPAGQAILRRSGSHPGFGAYQQQQQQHRVSDRLPRSIPNDVLLHSSSSTSSIPKEHNFQEPRSNSLTSNPRTSIPGIGHLQSQIRPSLVEIHRSASPTNVSSSISSSANGNSIFSNKASLSSVSTSVRNSIPQLLNDPIKEEPSAVTSNPDFRKENATPTSISSPKQHHLQTPSSLNHPQSYKPQPYTPKQFNRPVSSLRNNSTTISPKSARGGGGNGNSSPVISGSKLVMTTTSPNSSSSSKREPEENIETTRESKRSRSD